LYLQNVEESEWKSTLQTSRISAKKMSTEIKKVWHEMK